MSKRYQKYLIPRVSTPIKAGKITPMRSYSVANGVVSDTVRVAVSR